MIKKKMQTGGKVTSPKVKLKGRPMGGRIGEFQDMLDKAKAGDAQAKADLALERSVTSKFGEGPGAGPSGAFPKPKKKMGGAVKKQAAVAIAMKKAGKTPKKKMQYGGEAASMAPTMKKGGMMKKCKDGCK